jgi:hypothetical protein
MTHTHTHSRSWSWISFQVQNTPHLYLLTLYEPYSLLLSAGWFTFVAGELPLLCGMVKFRCSSCLYSKMSYKVYVLLRNVDRTRWLWGVQLCRMVRSRRCGRAASFNISEYYFPAQLHACHFAGVVTVDSGSLSAVLTSF